MPKKTLKRMVVILAALILAAGLAFGLWLGVNLWPRPIEAPLWSEKDLVLGEATEKNAWNVLPQTKEQVPANWGNLQQDFPLKSLFPELVDSQSDAYRFWTEARKELPTFATYLKDHQGAESAYKNLLENPNLIDDDPPGDQYTGFKVFLLLDLHKIAWTSVVQVFLSGDPENAFGFTLKMVQQDWSWLNSARSLLSNMAAIGCLKSDLDLLLLQRYSYRPIHWEEMQKTLGELNVEGIQMHRALVFEYLTGLKTMDAAIPDYLRKENWFIRVSYNPAFTRRDFNSFYRKLEDALKKPTAIPENFSQELNQELKERVHRRFWWFVNPAGKLLLSLITINQAEYFRDFYGKKADIFRDLKMLLYAQFDEKPETQPAPKPLATPEPANLPQDYSLEEQLKKPPEEIVHKKITPPDLEAARENKMLLEGIQLSHLSFEGKVVGQKVQSLQAGSFFQQMGLEIGDLILSINGGELSSAKGLELFLEKPRPGEDKVEVLLNRDGKFIRIELKLELTPPPAVSPPPA